MKAMLLWTSAISGLAFLLLALLLPPFHLFEASFPTICGVSAVAGFVRGMLDPLCFELCVELSYPIHPSVGGTVLTIWVHLVMIVMLFLPSHFLQESIMVWMAATMGLCVILLLGVKEDYQRLHMDEAGSSSFASSDHGAMTPVGWDPGSHALDHTRTSLLYDTDSTPSSSQISSTNVHGDRRVSSLRSVDRSAASSFANGTSGGSLLA
jgi:hypothetical protein